MMTFAERSERKLGIRRLAGHEQETHSEVKIVCRKGKEDDNKIAMLVLRK